MWHLFRFFERILNQFVNGSCSVDVWLSLCFVIYLILYLGSCTSIPLELIMEQKGLLSNHTKEKNKLAIPWAQKWYKWRPLWTHLEVSAWDFLDNLWRFIRSNGLPSDYCNTQLEQRESNQRCHANRFHNVRSKIQSFLSLGVFFLTKSMRSFFDWGWNLKRMTSPFLWLVRFECIVFLPTRISLKYVLYKIAFLSYK